MQKLICFFICYTFFTPFLYANFIKNDQLRLSHARSFNEWRFHSYHSDFNYNLFFNTGLGFKEELYRLYQNIEERKKEHFEETLDYSYSKPYDAEAKVAIGWQYKNFSQTFSSNAGSFLLVSNPVFPEVDLFLFHDYTISNKQNIRFQKLNAIITLDLLQRRFIEEHIYAGEAIDHKIKIKINNKKWHRAVFLSTELFYPFSSELNVFTKWNAIPLTKDYVYNYNEFRIGLSYLRNLNNTFDQIGFKIDMSPKPDKGFTPYDTLNFGAFIKINKYFYFDLFLNQRRLLGSEIRFVTSFIDASIGTFERTNDHFYFYKSRQFYLNLFLFI